MQKIINGKMYDTEKANKLAEFWNGRDLQRDFKGENTALYRTSSGAYFLAGRGGAMTRYARAVGDGTSGGTGLFLISEVEAKEFVEAHCSTEIYVAIFGDVVEG